MLAIDAIKHSDFISDHTDYLEKNDKGQWINSDGDVISMEEIKSWESQNWSPFIVKPVFEPGMLISKKDAIYWEVCFTVAVDGKKLISRYSNTHLYVFNGMGWERTTPDIPIGHDLYVAEEPIFWVPTTDTTAIQHLENNPGYPVAKLSFPSGATEIVSSHANQLWIKDSKQTLTCLTEVYPLLEIMKAKWFIRKG